MPNIIKATQYNKDIIRVPASVNGAAAQKLSAINEEQRAMDILALQEEHIADARTMASRIMDDARKKASGIVRNLEESTQKQCEKLRTQSQQEGHEKGLLAGKAEGYPLGFQEGYEEGLARAQNESRYLLDSFKKMTQDFLQEKDEIMRSFTEGLDELVFQIAKAVLKNEVELHPEVLAQMAYDAIAEYNTNAWIKICVSEKTLQTIMQNRPDLTQSMGENVKLVIGAELSDTDCICETPTQMIDAGIDTQFENIMQIMTESDER